MDKFHNDYIALLKFLFYRCVEAGKKFRIAYESASDRDLKYLFRNYAEQKTDYAEQLRNELLRYKESIDENKEISAEGIGGGDESLLNICIEIETKLLSDYNDALKEDVPGETKAVLSRQFAGIRKSQDKIRMFRDQGTTHF